MTGNLLINDETINTTMQRGLRLAETPQDQGGWAEFFNESEGLWIEDPYQRSNAAILLENGKNWLYAKCGGVVDRATGNTILNEAGRASVLGGYSDHFFPTIRASLPTSAINDLISIQATTRRQATIGYLNFTYGTTKGGITAGQKWVDAQVGLVTPTGSPLHANYTGELIENETLDTTGTADATIGGTLAHISGSGVRPGSVRIVIGSDIVQDNAAGGFVIAGGSNTISSGAINYNTGVIAITFGSNLSNSTAAVVSYRWNSEGGDLPELDINPTITMIETERRGLKTNISAEGMFDFQQEFGLPYDGTTATAAAAIINFETATQVIRLMWSASTEYTTFNITTPSGISRNDHLQDLLFRVDITSNAIWKNLGGLGYGNFIITDELAAAYLAPLGNDQFQKAPKPPVGLAMGLHRIGTLQDKYEVYKYMHLGRESGAREHGNMLMGWVGGAFGQAGIVMAPYQAFYTTDPLTTPDFVTKQGFASRYALKLINALAYLRIGFVNS